MTHLYVRSSNLHSPDHVLSLYAVIKGPYKHYLLNTLIYCWGLFIIPLNFPLNSRPLQVFLQGEMLGVKHNPFVKRRINDGPLRRQRACKQSYKPLTSSFIFTFAFIAVYFLRL